MGAKKSVQNFSENLNRNNHLRDSVLNGIIILKVILKKYSMNRMGLIDSG
jgi:hypothetical protein